MVIYRLSQLEGLGWSAEDLAKALKITPESLKRLKAGKAEISATTELELGKLLSRYVRKKLIESGHRPPPRIVHTNKVADTPPPTSDSVIRRGVYEERIVPPGERWFKVVMSDGKIGRVQFPDELVDANFEENLWRRLDAMDPAQGLKAI